MEQNRQPELDLILAQVARSCGVSFDAYRTNTLYRRVSHRMRSLSIDEPADYLATVQRDPAELARLFEALFIKTTALFRDPVTLDLLRNVALPTLVRRRLAEGAQTIRVWVPACATGEEAFSIAMCLLDATEDRSTIEAEVVASDIDPGALDRARTGLVRPESLDRLPSGFERFLRRRADAYAISRDVLDIVSFCQHDLLSADRIAPTRAVIASFDVISCCNLLIYLRKEAQRLVCERLVKSLAEGGVLVLGRAELPSCDEGHLEPLVRGEPVYQKRE